jgi:RecG-like helicase
MMRPEILFPLFAPITSLKGVGPRVAPLLEKLAGPVVRDVLFLKPHSIVRRTPATVSNAIDGEVMTFEVTIAGVDRPRGPNQPWRMRTFDQTGFLSLVFFGSFGASLEHRHPPNARRIVSGKVEQFRDEWQMVHPDYMLAPEKAGEIPDIEPIYPATQGLPARTVRKFAVEALERAPELPEWQDAAWLKRETLPTWREALVRLHEPESDADLSPLSPHLRRLAYDELLAQQLAMAQRKAERRREPAASSPSRASAAAARAPSSGSSAGCCPPVRSM